MADIIVRKLEVDFSEGFSRHWLGGDPFRTHLFNTFSLTFPIGEQYFIDCVKAAAPQITDPKLREEIKGFIGQEATHRHLHALCNEQLFKQGLRHISERLVKWRAKRSEKFDVRSRMAITMAYEHLTAAFADGVLRHPEWLEDAEDKLKLLWTWHCVEETEHKALANDVYKAIGGGYGRRVGWYVYIGIAFTLDTVIQQTNNLYRDGQLFKPRTWISAVRTLFGFKGMMWHMLPQVLVYFSPRFDPWHRDSRAIGERWLKEKSSAFREVRGAGEPMAAAVATPV